jgi:hypothetical protein
MDSNMGKDFILARPPTQQRKVTSVSQFPDCAELSRKLCHKPTLGDLFEQRGIGITYRLDDNTVTTPFTDATVRFRVLILWRRLLDTLGRV